MGKESRVKVIVTSLLTLFSFVVFYLFIITEAHMFWWLYRSPYRVEDPSKPWPIILWLQGGPVSIVRFGCNLNENNPISEFLNEILKTFDRVLQELGLVILKRLGLWTPI